MSKRTAELVSEWDSVPFDGGYDGLRTLADQEFSGAVVAGSTQLFMLNGTVVGILDGDLDTFEDASGTARQAPHDALPLLVVMQARAEEPRAQYYTEDTSIQEVDRTLTDGKFTGYVELSENVLSGDYYLVYHQGRSMSVAWVGAGERLITDDEAFDQADGEVGIYDVMPADIEPIELPESESGSTGGAVGGLDEATTDTPDPTEEASGPTDTTDSAGTSTGLDEDATFPGAGPADDATGGTNDQGTARDDATETAGASGAGATADSDSGVSEPTSANGGESVTERGSAASGPPGSKAAGASHGTAVDSVAERGERDDTDRQPGQPTDRNADTTAGEQRGAEPESAVEDTGATEAETRTQRPSRSTASTEPETVPSEPDEPTVRDVSQADGATPDQSAAQPPQADESGTQSATPDATGATSADLETRSIPSLDPELSASTPDGSSQSFPTATEATASDPDPAESATAPDTETGTTQPPANTGQAPPTGELEAKLDEREATISRLEGEIQELSADNERLAAERDNLEAELEEARAELERLRTQLQEADDTAGTAGPALSPGEAIDGTNLFVRYHSKGEGTLEKAQDGGADKATVDENLRIEYHTQFDGENATVDGEPFETFLQESIHYRFANWLVRELLYEIRDTGHANALSVLYGALPKIDRAELNGQVSVSYTEDGQQHREQQQFDVVVRDRMGNPLVVANINDSREPATESQMTGILQDAERVGTTSESLAAAFLVTSSFFEPGALETAEEATSSGLFSRDKHKSFVNLSRKGGYHLCLLEARNNEFHLAVPEL